MKLKVKVNKSKRKKEKTKKKKKKTRHSSILFLCIWVWRIPCQDGTVHTVHTAGEVCTSGHGNFSTTLSIAMGLWQLKFKHCYLVYNPRSPTLAFHHDVFSHPRGHMVAWRRLLKISKPLGPQSRRVHIVLYYPVITSRERKSKDFSNPKSGNPSPSWCSEGARRPDGWWCRAEHRAMIGPPTSGSAGMPRRQCSHSTPYGSLEARGCYLQQ